MELDALIRKQNGIIASRPLEGCESLNDINRKIIYKFSETRGTAYLGRINPANENDTQILTLYTGQQILNFDCDFVVAEYNEKLVSLIATWRRGDAASLDKMFSCIKKLNGVLLLWS